MTNNLSKANRTRQPYVKRVILAFGGLVKLAAFLVASVSIATVILLIDQAFYNAGQPLVSENGDRAFLVYSIFGTIFTWGSLFLTRAISDYLVSIGYLEDRLKIISTLFDAITEIDIRNRPPGYDFTPHLIGTVVAVIAVTFIGTVVMAILIAILGYVFGFV